MERVAHGLTAIVSIWKESSNTPNDRYGTGYIIRTPSTYRGTNTLLLASNPRNG